MNKKIIVFLISFICYTCSLFSQKVLLDSSAYSNWPSVEHPTISGDGKYVVYNINNVPTGSKTMVLQSTQTDWKMEFQGEVNAQFTDDSKYLIFRKEKDSLVIITLGPNKMKYITNVSSFQIINGSGHSWISYSLSDQAETLLLKDLNTGKERRYSNVAASWFNKNGSVLVIKTINKDKPNRQALSWIDMADGKTTYICEGTIIKALVFNTKYHQIAFDDNGSIWSYKRGDEKANCIADSNALNIDKDLAYGHIDYFSKDGERLFIKLNEKIKSEITPSNVQVWSYADKKLQSELLKKSDSPFGPESYFAVINLRDKKVIRLQQKNEFSFNFQSDENTSDTLTLMEHWENAADKWSVLKKMNNILVFTNNGERKHLSQLDSKRNIELSPARKYLIYFDEQLLNYFSYEIKTGITRNLTNNIQVSWLNIVWNDDPSIRPRGIFAIKWLPDDKAALIYDQNDIWKIDPLNKQQPINLTNGFGLKHDLVFSFISNERVYKNDKIILSTFNLENKSNGFYSKQMSKSGEPEQLTMGSYLYMINTPYYVPQGSDFTPLKAKNAEVYLVRRMSATEAPNYFFTKDFKSFRQLSTLQPEKKYNWYTTELHTWNSLDGRKLQGILYKPENFDLNKKYPVIFHYYERKSNGLNAYLEPECNGATIDIPTMVSNGYLVFSPDIYYKVGNPMQGTYDAVVSAAQYVSTLPFVNPKKMGIQGHSWGGAQTNYLVTHTNIFSAAVSSSGIADWVSHYGGLIAGSESLESFYETGQGRMAASLWEKPDAYIRNSPIFQVDKVSTPLLLTHGVKDHISLYSNILEFFTGLRRMGKICWMLVYPEAGHQMQGKDAEDMSIRMMQFFDHYLKDKPAPVWMTRGISPSVGRIEKGYEYDTEIKTPGPGLLTSEEQRKVDSLNIKKPITINLR